MILDATRSRRQLPRRAALLALGLGAALLVPFAMLRPAAKADPLTAPAADAVALDNGVTVELVGVGSSPTGDGEDWWAADGTPLPEAPDRGGARFHDIQEGVGTQYLRRALLFRLRSGQDVDASTTGYAVDPSSRLLLHGPEYDHQLGGDLRLNDAALKADQPATGVAVLAFPIAEKAITYRFGVASGPWETVAVTPNTLRPAPGTIKPSVGGRYYGPNAWVNEKPGFGYTDTSGKNHQVSLLGGRPPLGDVARRLQALDSAGNVLPLDDGSGYFVQISAEDLNKIAAFRLQTRPYQWTEFKNVSLQPKTAAGVTPVSPIPTPPAPAGFEKTYPSGITVALNALTERRADGGRWWQPDGTLLPGPIKDRDSNFTGWPRDEHPRSLLFTLTAPRDVDYSEATQFLTPGMPPEPVSAPDFVGHLRKGEPGGGGRNENFPAAARTCTLRYGLAAGPWQTASVQKVHFTPEALLHRVTDPDKDYNGDVTLELSQHPRLLYVDAAGTRHEQPFLTHPLGEVARRFVAVGADGVPIPLTVCTAGVDTGFVSLAFSEHSVVHGYNAAVDLTKIREVRLQTRPYEWAEFKDIALRPSR